MPSQNISNDAEQMELQRFQILVSAISDYAIYMLDVGGHVVSWNTGAQRFKGYKPEEIIGSHFSCFFTEEDRASGLPDVALKTAAAEGRFESEGWRLRKDGSRFWANAIVDAIRDEDGRLLGFAKITRDISEKREAAAALKRTEHALQQAQKMESIGKLTGGVAHDFNNLLQIISGNLQLLSVELAGNEALQSRVNIGRFVLAMEDMLSRTLGESIEIETIISGGLWNTFIDITQVENALLNLALNARDAMENGGKLTIEVCNAYLDDNYAGAHADVAAGQYVMLAVTDTGSGIAPDILNQVFEPFFSTKPEGKGTGLGLSMVYGFIKQSGGNVQIYSEVGLGTTVKLYLPRSLQGEETPLAPTEVTVLGGSETILVAEDDPQLCATVVDMLKQLGYQVLKAEDAAGALTIIESGIHIDLLFTDVVMPGPLRSPDLARKARERVPDLAVLFTSGYTQNAIVHGGRLDPGVELLPKPYTREELGRKVRHALANQKHLKQLRAHVERVQTAPLRPLIGAAQLRILLVEDEPTISAITIELLTRLGHTAIPAASATAALTILETASFDILIADVELPDMSGIALANEIKEKNPNINVIYATGQSQPEGVENNAVLLSKPYDIQSLAAALRKFTGA